MFPYRVAPILFCLAMPVTAWCQTPSFVTSWGGFGTGNSQFRTPVGVAVDVDGNVYTVDSNNNRVQKFTSAGVYLTQWPTMDTPTSIAVHGPDIYVSLWSSDYVQRFTTDGTQVEGLIIGTGGPSSGVAVDAAGNTYVANDGRIVKFTQSGAYVMAWPAHANRVAIGMQGNILVSTDRSIRSFTPTGVFIAEWGTFGSGDGQFVSPAGLSVDMAGNIYVVDYGNHRIQVLSETGAYVTQWGSAGSGSGEFLNPVGIAVDGRGYVYVADTNNSRIQMFAPLPTPARSPSWGRVKASYR